MLELTVTAEDPGTADSLALVGALLEELEPLYHNLWANPFEPDELRGARCYFAIARRGREAVACGGLRPLDERVAEVRRMYVVPSERRVGVAQVVLSGLEATARQMGYEALRLETGLYQPAAIRLYDRAGFTRIPPYGPYVGDPLSVCFEKRLVT